MCDLPYYKSGKRAFRQRSQGPSWLGPLASKLIFTNLCRSYTRGNLKGGLGSRAIWGGGACCFGRGCTFITRAGVLSSVSLASSSSSLLLTEEGGAGLRVETCRAFLPRGAILHGTVNLDGEAELSIELGFSKRAGWPVEYGAIKIVKGDSM